jgi:putative SOS response-associated peptidase YedK
MCNRYKYEKATLDDYLTDFSELKIPLVFPTGVPNIEPRADIRPTNRAWFFRPVEPSNTLSGVEAAQLRWGLVPFFSKAIDRKFLCTNARSETVSKSPAYRDAFKRSRCLIPADGYYEWTGDKGAKVKWMFTRADGKPMMFPGLWDSATIDGERLESFTMLTCAPGPDAANYHDRQPVVLDPEHWPTWLDLAADVMPLLCGSPEGGLHIERAPPEVKA